MNIPSQAVEAAGRTLEYCIEQGLPLGETARAVVEASAPHIASKTLWDAADAFSYGEYNRILSQDEDWQLDAVFVLVEWLRGRAQGERE